MTLEEAIELWREADYVYNSSFDDAESETFAAEVILKAFEAYNTKILQKLEHGQGVPGVEWITSDTLDRYEGEIARLERLLEEEKSKLASWMVWED